MGWEGGNDDDDDDDDDNCKKKIYHLWPSTVLSTLHVFAQEKEERKIGGIRGRKTEEKQALLLGDVAFHPEKHHFVPALAHFPLHTQRGKNNIYGMTIRG